MTFEKIVVPTPVVDILGDEMTRILWEDIKDKLIHPYLKLEDLRVFDLGIMSRDETDDQITKDCAQAIIDAKVGIKCATITASPARVAEFGLKKQWKSPNGTIRNTVPGAAIFRAPILLKNVPKYIPSWEKPVIMSRHSYADQYKAQDFVVPGAGTVKLTYTPAEGVQAEPIERIVNEFEGEGVAMGIFNTGASVSAWARNVFSYAIKVHDDEPEMMQGVMLAHKDTIMKQYDGYFRDTYRTIFEEEFKAEFEKRGMWYEEQLIDNFVATLVKTKGGFLAALRNRDGDVLSDMAAQGCGSLGLMTSVLYDPVNEILEAEASHGTVQKHYYRYLALRKDGLDHEEAMKLVSTNPTASIFAWTRGLAHRGRLDGNEALVTFCEKLEQATLSTIDDKMIMTKDLAILMNREDWASSFEFIAAIKETLDELL
ncbi:hypothetical protein PCE1_002794 [Barthelona sp. PCE]